MTVLRSRKLATAQQPPQQPPSPNINNIKTNNLLEIQPITPDKQIQPMTNSNSNQTTPVSSSQKLGLLVGSDSGRVVRRSARLSLNSTSYNEKPVENVVDENKSSGRKRKVAVRVESNVESGEVVTDAVVDTGVVSEPNARLSLNSSSSRKRKAGVRVESKEESGEGDGLGLGVRDGVVNTGVVSGLSARLSLSSTSYNEKFVENVGESKSSVRKRKAAVRVESKETDGVVDTGVVSELNYVENVGEKSVRKRKAVRVESKEESVEAITDGVVDTGIVGEPDVVGRRSVRKRKASSAVGVEIKEEGVEVDGSGLNGVEMGSELGGFETGVVSDVNVSMEVDTTGVVTETNGVENVVGEKSVRKRNASAKSPEVDGSGFNVTDAVVSDVTEPNAVSVSDTGADQFDNSETQGIQTPRFQTLQVEELGNDQEEGDVLPSADNKGVSLLDLNQLPPSKDDEETQEGSAGIGRATRRRRFSREEKNKGVLVVDVEEEDVGIGRKRKGRVFEVDFSSSDSGEDSMDEDFVLGNGSRIGLEEKGKGKAVEFDSSASDSGEDNMDEDFVLGNGSRIGLEEKGKEKVVEADSPARDPVDTDEEVDVGVMDGNIAADAGRLGSAFGRDSTSSSRMKERFKDAARRNATRFAYFSNPQAEQDLDVDDDDDDEPEQPQREANADEEDWPGPFSTALKIIKDRAENMAPQKKKKTESVPLIWAPKEKQQPLRRAAPSLQDLCMTIMSQHVDSITSLESVPDALRHKLTRLLCDSRKMNHHFFELLASGTPTEIRVRDCSWLTEEQFTKTIDKTDASNLTVLQLDQCGRCLPDYVLLPILAVLPSPLSALTTISLKGACRLSDAGLKALVDSAPALRSINLGCCSLLTVDAINNLADKLGPVLKELYIDECFDLDAKHILPALLKLEQLEVLSVAHNESIDNSFIIKFVAARGQKMKELVLSNCTKLTDKALRAISKSCPGLCVIDLTNVCKLKDKSLAHLANGCPKIQILKFCRNTFSDEAVAAYLEACGAPLRELSLNHINKVANHTAISLAKHARNLETLDLSFCREMTNEALGLIADSCSSLKTLKLFGCTQITNIFTDGHSNEGVKIIGLVESQILKNIEAVELLPLRYSAA